MIKKPGKEKEAAVKKLKKMLRNIDDQAFWKKVLEKTALEIDAFELARAKSRAKAGGQVFLLAEA
jgi:hypothetical protein